MAVMNQRVTEEYAIYHADCMDIMQNLQDESIDFSIYSPPFGGLYSYSSDERDLSNCKDYDDFLEHYRYIVTEKARITKRGRLTAVHCADIPSGNTGKDYLIDLPGDIIRLHQTAGFNLVARHAIWKEPLWVRNRTMTKNLAHAQLCRDAAYSGVASADQLLMFRRRGENRVPIEHPVGLLDYAGESPIPADIRGYRGWKGDQKENRYSHWIWRQYASSVWDDIRMNRVLPFRESKEEDDEKHVHPLQLDVIERAIILRTNPGEKVFTPFMGVGSEVYMATRLLRKGIGAELKASYFNQATKNLECAVEELRAGDGLDLFAEVI